MLPANLKVKPPRSFKMKAASHNTAPTTSVSYRSMNVESVSELHATSSLQLQPAPTEPIGVERELDLSKFEKTTKPENLTLGDAVSTMLYRHNLKTLKNFLDTNYRINWEI
ncbi:MAG: hypothetical protein MMC33_010862, partial [Icmadophila ericetorum]|nr:hypothetical protein [Icmadophila ericetorum]